MKTALCFKNIAEERVLKLEAELNAGESDLDAAQILLDEFASDSRLPEATISSTSPSGLDDLQQKTEAVLLSLAARVNFTRDSLACLFSFIPNWAPVIDAVKSLQREILWRKPSAFMLDQVGMGSISELAVQMTDACITARGTTRTK